MNAVHFPNDHHAVFSQQLMQQVDTPLVALIQRVYKFQGGNGETILRSISHLSFGIVAKLVEHLDSLTHCVYSRFDLSLVSKAHGLLRCLQLVQEILWFCVLHKLKKFVPVHVDASIGIDSLVWLFRCHWRDREEVAILIRVAVSLVQSLEQRKHTLPLQTTIIIKNVDPNNKRPRVASVHFNHKTLAGTLANDRVGGAKIQDCLLDSSISTLGSRLSEELVFVVIRFNRKVGCVVLAIVIE
mmetsp:Transcript_36394/g.54313  ORF Transcript_36394/g.54313 Transcript_36394/m.54313 type:complete len:242 (+) Transcript_36394:256-981(+)